MEYQHLIENTIDVLCARGNIYALVSVYKEFDAMNAGGQLYCVDVSPEGASKTVFSTNDAVSSLWASPAGHLWIASANGNVFTTAPVASLGSDDPELEFRDDRSGYGWKVMPLPRQRATGLKPNIAALWGTNDRDLFAACFEGCVYCWDGIQWAQMDIQVPCPLSNIWGSGSTDVYCGGLSSLIIHFDGRTWVSVKVPEDLGDDTVITGIRSPRAGHAYAVTLRGHILEGSRSGFQLLRATEHPWTGIAWFQNRLILSANPGGAWELVNDQVRELKSNFASTGICEGGSLLFFVETDQPEGPGMVQYDPSDPEPWDRITFAELG